MDESKRTHPLASWELDKYIRAEKFRKFMIESNTIEGEKWLNDGDMDAIKYIFKNVIKTRSDILEVHAILGKHLKKDWVGKFRKCNVCVGEYTAPDYKQVRELMKKYVKELPLMNSWTAHNEFEKIHPFLDLNGRVGRLIWFKKALKEGYNFSIPFLQKYYYQTLSQYEKESE